MTLRWKFTRHFRRGEEQDEVQLDPTADVDSVAVLPLDDDRGKTGRTLLCASVGFFLLTSVVLAIAIVVIVKKQHDSSNNPQSGDASGDCNDVCLTEGCVMAAARVGAALDKSVKPCDDFYNFACGTWIKTHVIPEDKGAFGTFTKLRDDVAVIMKSLLEADIADDEIEAVKKSKDYYNACVNETRIEELGLTYILNFLEQDLGGWPVLGLSPGGNWNQIAYRLEELLVRARRGFNYIPVIDIGVGQDEKKPTNHILYIDQPNLGMPSRDYYLKGRDDPTLMAYQTFIEETAVAFGADSQTAKTDAKDIVDFEVELANITVPREDRRDPEKLYNKMTVADLSQNFTGVDWDLLVKGFFNITGEPFNNSEPLIVVSPPFFEKLGALIAKYPPRTVANYIVSQPAVFKAQFLPSAIQTIYGKYRKALYGTATEPPRWDSCSSNVRSAMPEVVGRLFVKETFKKEAKVDVLDLISKLKIAFGSMIDDLPWMEAKTKTFARDKLTDVEPRIGYPEMVYNDTALNEKFQDIPVYSDDALKTLMSLAKGAVLRSLTKLRKPTDKSKWDMSAAVVNAYYNPETNQITFPAAILQPPFYTKDQPAYLNYGGIGYVIGHELTHGFDDQGRLYDGQGNLHSWWTDQDAEKFKDKAQCIIDQYGNFSVPGTGGMTLNGITTQGENIADNGGIKESFKAYREYVKVLGKEEQKLPGLDYSPNQLYFLNAAQVFALVLPQAAIVVCHIKTFSSRPACASVQSDLKATLSPDKVYGPMQNFDEFSKAWNCPAGSFMNPTKKCSVW